jgi:putative Mn2+ efflux pump MntP
MAAVFFLALSVAIDACAAAVCCGLGIPGFQFKDGLRMSCWFGGFQSGMSLIGGLVGSELNEHVQVLGAVIAFGLLLYLGGVQTISAFHPQNCRTIPSLDGPQLAVLALATSLDALAVGVSLAYLEVGLLPAALVIGLVTLVLSLCSAMIGRQGGQHFHRAASFCGGGILLLIGTRILVEALV